MSGANDVIAIDPVEGVLGHDGTPTSAPASPSEASPPPVRGLRHAGRVFAASFVGVGRGIYLFPLDTTFRTVGLRYGWLKSLFTRTPAPIMAGLGQLRAERAAWPAARQVPAHGSLLAQEGGDAPGPLPLRLLGRPAHDDQPE